MRPRASHEVGRPTSVAARIRLPLAAAVTAVLLVISFSVGAQSEGGVGEGTAQTTCPTGLLKNGGFELPVNTPGAGPLNWGTSQWFPSSQFSREEVNAHSGDKSARITAVTANDA